jgi:hypothetical protein
VVTLGLWPWLLDFVVVRSAWHARYS